MAHVAVGKRRTVAHGHDITAARENMCFAENDVFAFELSRADYDKEGVAVVRP